MFEAPRYAYSDQNLISQDFTSTENRLGSIKKEFKALVHDFDREGVRIYQAQFTRNAQQNKSVLVVDLVDIKNYKQRLYEHFLETPIESLQAMSDGLTEYAHEKHPNKEMHSETDKWQVSIRSDQNPYALRNLTAVSVNKLLVLNGIVVSTTKPYIKATTLRVQCKSCQSIKEIPMTLGQSANIPRKCTASPNNKCELDSFVVLPSSDVTDCQSLRIQENPEEIPTGEVPRSAQLIATGYNVGKCIPGDRVKITGIRMVDDKNKDGSKNMFSSSYVYVIGVEKIKERTTADYTTQDEEEFKRMAKDPQIYEKIYKSIAPGIYGSEDIKKIIACMLFGGTRKKLPDDTRLRGDINVLLLGDPSTAKSQFLKFVEMAASVAVYTSGKGSSAAGLTVSINRDNATGEFTIEGGALVLADGGIVCIDEFDKMRPADRVAIHEAMEQQTISVAKAGITTRLNSRTSVLAAANPIHGRFDDTQTTTDQIELQSTILSRFDSIFIVRDINTSENNERIAKHILDLHHGRSLLKQQDSEFPFERLKKYINYARQKCHPKMGNEASEKLQNMYVEDRQISRKQKQMKRSSMPITVRQLEAVIRISEALAKMKLREQVTSLQVDEAHRLFEISTLKTLMDSKGMGVDLIVDADEIRAAEEAIRKKVAVGSNVKLELLVEQMQRFKPDTVKRALHNLLLNGDFKETRGGSSIVRLK